MHERSLVSALLGQVAQVARRFTSGTLREVRVEIGPLAGVECLQFSGAFADLRSGTVASDANLVIEEARLTGRCQDCGVTFVIENFHFRCAECHSSRIQVTGGDSIRLVSVSFDDGGLNQ